MDNPNCNTKHKNFQHLIDKERHEIEVRFNKNNGSVYRICSGEVPAKTRMSAWNRGQILYNIIWRKRNGLIPIPHFFCFRAKKLYARSFPAVCMYSLLMTTIVIYNYLSLIKKDQVRKPAPRLNLRSEFGRLNARSEIAHYIYLKLTLRLHP